MAILPFKHFVYYRNGFERWSHNMGIDANKASVLMLCILYHNGKISRESFIAKMQQYFEKNMLSRKIGTYYSVVLDEWFNDVTMDEILIQEAHETCVEKDISIENYLKYLNLGLNRCKNWCVNFIATIVNDVMYSFYENERFKFIKDCNFTGIDIDYLSYEDAEAKYDLSNGYCCKDCDGCLGAYKRSRYERYYKPDQNKIDDINEKIRNYFFGLKKHNKNKNDELFVLFLR